MVRLRLLLAGSVFAICLAWPLSAYAYDGNAAATWADNHATSYTCGTTGYPECQTEDCTKFISLALNYGGHYPQHLGDGFEDNPQNWFLTKNGLGLWINSYTWAYVSDQWAYQLWKIPGGWLTGQDVGTSNAQYTMDQDPGDLLGYDWDGNGTMDHLSMLTTPGIDSGWSSTKQSALVDAHQNDRKRKRWTLSQWNLQRNTTVIHFMHIAAQN